MEDEQTRVNAEMRIAENRVSRGWREEAPLQDPNESWNGKGREYDEDRRIGGEREDLAEGGVEQGERPVRRPRGGR